MRNSLFSLNGYNPIIPNELKKYFKDKIIDNSYIKKLSVLLYSNDKNYDEKRSIINKLTFGFDENNREYLTKSKFNCYSANSNSFNDDKKADNQHINKNKRINNNLLYFREPQVIRNNEKLMMDFFKRKDKFIDKLPYLSRSTNDLINYNYKREKDKSDIMKNWMSSNNNYLNIIPKIKKLRLKRINLPSHSNYLFDKKDLDLKIKTSFSVKNISHKSDENKKFKINKENKTLDQKEETEKINPNSMIYENGSTDINKIKHKREKGDKLYEKYNNLKKLSNEEVLKKIENSIEAPGFDLQKGMFSGVVKRKNENKIDFLFGKRLSGMQ